MMKLVYCVAVIDNFNKDREKFVAMTKKDLYKIIDAHATVNKTIAIKRIAVSDKV